MGNLDSVKFRFYSVCDRTDIFAHGAAIAYHKGRFFATFAINEERENSILEKTVCWVSTDGENWKFLSVIGEPMEGLGRSHGILWEQEGVLYAFNASFTASARHGLPGTAGILFPGLKTEGFSFHDETDSWETMGVIADDFWPMNQPAKLENGNYIIPGINSGFFSACLIGTVQDGFTKIDIPTVGLGYTESACITEGDVISLFMRNSRRDVDRDKRFLATAVSKDSGRHWQVRETDFYDNDSKPAAITLSNGFRCIVGNHLPGQKTSRGSLDLLLFPPKESEPRLCVIREQKVPSDLQEKYAPQTEQNAIAYPFCLEHDNKLYVIYSSSGEDRANHNRIELAVADINDLCENV